MAALWLFDPSCDCAKLLLHILVLVVVPVLVCTPSTRFCLTVDPVLDQMRAAAVAERRRLVRERLIALWGARWHRRRAWRGPHAPWINYPLEGSSHVLRRTSTTCQRGHHLCQTSISTRPKWTSIEGLQCPHHLERLWKMFRLAVWIPKEENANLLRISPEERLCDTLIRSTKAAGVVPE